MHRSPLGRALVPVRTKDDFQKEAAVPVSPPTPTRVNLGGKQLIKALFSPLTGRVEGETQQPQPFPLEK